VRLQGLVGLSLHSSYVAPAQSERPRFLLAWPEHDLKAFHSCLMFHCVEQPVTPF